jgi:hypothetical protein
LKCGRTGAWLLAMRPPSVASFAACKGFSGRFMPSGMWITTLVPSDFVILSSPEPFLLLLTTTAVPEKETYRIHDFLSITHEKCIIKKGINMVQTIY